MVIGLTGPIASGKSTVAAMLAERGAEVIDADQVYHTLLAPHAPLWTSIVDRFGRGILREDDTIDRARLADIVFNDREALGSLDRLTHPAIVQEVRSIAARSSADVVVVEAIKLAQSELINDVNELWLITADPDVRLGRLMCRDGIDQHAARSRIESATGQLPTGMVANVTIDTTPGMKSTRRAVESAWDSATGPMGAMQVRGRPARHEEEL